MPGRCVIPRTTVAVPTRLFAARDGACTNTLSTASMETCCHNSASDWRGCSDWRDYGQCRQGDACRYAHGEIAAEKGPVSTPDRKRPRQDDTPQPCSLVVRLEKPSPDTTDSRKRQHKLDNRSPSRNHFARSGRRPATNTPEPIGRTDQSLFNRVLRLEQIVKLKGKHECRDFKKGSCKFETGCRFEHVDGPTPTKETTGDRLN